MFTRKEKKTRQISCLLISTCVSPKRFREKGLDILYQNKELVGNIIALIDDIRLDIQYISKVNLQSVHEEDTLPVENIEDVDNIADTILCDSSRSSYERIRKSLNSKGKMTLPSYYQLAKRRPQIESFSIRKEDNTCPWYDAGRKSNTLCINSTVEEQTQTIVPIEKYTASSIIAHHSNENSKLQLSDVYEKIKKEENENCEIEGVRITGGYNKVCQLLTTKIERSQIELNNEILVIDSYDGALHPNRKKDESSIISFSSQLVSSQIMQLPGYTAGNSKHILTWQQLKGDEKPKNIFPSIRSYFNEKKEMRKNKVSNKYTFLELHDGKMLYMLCQHSLYNRRNFPFLLCSCSRGAGVKNGDHECEIIQHTEQKELWNRSLRRWTRKRVKLKDDEKYEYFQHMDWVDVENKGVSHFGLHPDVLPRENIRFDVFHLRCAITRRLMTNLRKFLMIHSVDLIMSLPTRFCQSSGEITTS